MNRVLLIIFICNTIICLSTSSWATLTHTMYTATSAANYNANDELYANAAFLPYHMTYTVQLLTNGPDAGKWQYEYAIVFDSAPTAGQNQGIAFLDLETGKDLADLTYSVSMVYSSDHSTVPTGVTITPYGFKTITKTSSNGYQGWVDAGHTIDISATTSINGFEWGIAPISPKKDVTLTVITATSPMWGKMFLDSLNLTTNYGYLLGRNSKFNNSTHPAFDGNTVQSGWIPVPGDGTGTFKISLSFPGTGNGTVTSSPTGIACSTSCSADFSAGDTVTLTPTASEFNLFSGWSGACSGTGDCILPLDADKDVTATFSMDAAHMTYIASTSTYYSTLQQAYDNVPASGTIEAWGTDFTENFTAGVSKAAILKGGYNGAYTSNNGYTTLHGTMTIASGALTVEQLVIQ